MGTLHLGPGDPTACLHRDPRLGRGDAHPDLDVVLAGEVALAQRDTGSELVGRRLGDEELALDLDAHLTSMGHRSLACPPSWAPSVQAGARGRTPPDWSPRSTDAGFEIEPPVAVTATVFDTFDGRLHHAGLRLEHDGHSLVLSGPGTVPARLDREDAPRFARDLPPGPLRNRLLDIVEVRALLPLVTVSAIVRRAVSRNRDGKVVSAVRDHRADLHRSWRRRRVARRGRRAHRLRQAGRQRQRGGRRHRRRLR